MNTNHDLERLISRFLDDEASAAERAALRKLARSDTSAEALFEEHAALDREIRAALRRGLGRPLHARRAQPVWRSVGRAAALGLAACLAAFMWLGPTELRPARPQNPHDRLNAASWFGGNSINAPRTAGGDEWIADAPPARADVPARRWIVVPSGRDGELLVIEVPPPRTPLRQRDF